MPKPIIAGEEAEWDARTLTAAPTAEYLNVATWPDSSGNANDLIQFGSERRFEHEGWGGTQAAVRAQPILQECWDFPGTFPGGDAFGGGNWTLFMVFGVIDLSSHIGLFGSDGAGSPGPRFIHVFAHADGSVVLNRSLDSWDLQSAAGVLVEGQQYVMTVTKDGTAGSQIRVNGVQVAVNAADLLSQVTFVVPAIGVAFDQISGGVGRVFGDKRYCWVSGYNQTATPTEITQMEQFLGGRFGVAVPGAGGTKPTIGSIHMEYDVNTLVETTLLESHDLVNTWPDSSGNARDATVRLGTPEMEGGAEHPDAPLFGSFSGGLECVRMHQAPGPASFGLTDGTWVVGTDLTMFLVFRVFDLTECALLGGSSFTDFRMLEVFVRNTGAIVFSFGTNEGSSLAAESAAGLIAADGQCHVLTLQHSGTAGKIIRLNGVQVAAEPLATGNLVAWDTARVGFIGGVIDLIDTELAYIAGYSNAVSEVDVILMENYLTETWCAAPAGGGPWFPAGTQLPIDTTWVP